MSSLRFVCNNNLLINSLNITKWAAPSLGNWRATAQIITLKAASLFTDPICKVREYFYTFYILNETCVGTIAKISRSAFLALGIVVCSILAPFTTPVGVVLRGAVIAMQSKPYIYMQSGAPGKRLPDNRVITLVSHNQCYMPAGYSITDGHVTPPSHRERIKANIDEILRLNPDVVCLYEVVDIYDADYISSRLSDYPFIIPVAGLRAIGPCSMMYVASKYEIVEDSIEFTPFIKGTELTGASQFSEKGFLSFDLKSQGATAPFTSVVCTHLQHSNIPGDPTPDEKEVRKLQMMKIAAKVDEKIRKQLGAIVTGDLNQPEAELVAFLKTREINFLRRDSNAKGQVTWGGDEWSARLMGKTPSKAEVLDYTLITGNIASIQTAVHETDYEGARFSAEARSDHYLLFNTIKVGS